MANTKDRLDLLLVEKGLFASREQARRAVMAGQVYAGSERLLKPGTMIPITTELSLKGADQQYVSRGGLKLAKALPEFAVRVTDRTALDIGASTGGFTDCLLQNGAKHVYAVDVGYGQLDWRLRQDARVSVLERTNIRYIEKDQVPIVDIITIDVSFISLTKVLPVAYQFLREEGDLIALIKPQFEAGPGQVGKQGVVRDAQVHQRVLLNICVFATQAGYSLCGLSYSPITGPKGNIEFLIHLRKQRDQMSVAVDQEQLVANVVASAHKELGKCEQ